MGKISGYVSYNGQDIDDAMVVLHKYNYGEEIVNTRYNSVDNAIKGIQANFFKLYRITGRNNLKGYFLFTHVLSGNYYLEATRGDSIGKIVDFFLDEEGFQGYIDVYPTGVLEGSFSSHELFFIKEIGRYDTCSTDGTLRITGLPAGDYSVYLFQNSVFNEVLYQGGKVPVYSDSITILSHDMISISSE